MVGLAQLVSASGCGPEGRGFESHISPQKKRKAPHGSGQKPERTGQQGPSANAGPSGHLHTGWCFSSKQRLCAEGKTESTPRRADRKTESGCSAVGSARGLGPRCRRFESCHSDQKSAENEYLIHFRLIFAYLGLYFQIQSGG